MNYLRRLHPVLSTFAVVAAIGLHGGAQAQTPAERVSDNAGTAASEVTKTTAITEPVRNAAPQPPLIRTKIVFVPAARDSERMWATAATASQGFELGLLVASSFLDADGINALPVKLGFDRFDTSGLVSPGISMKAIVLPYLSFGILAFQGSVETSGRLSASIRRNLQMELTYGGGTVQAIYPTRRVEFFGGLGVGWTTLRYRLTQDDTSIEPLDYEHTVDLLRRQVTSSSYRKELVAGFLGFRPEIGIGLKLLPWLKLTVSGLYDYMVVPENGLLYSEYSAPLQNSPEINIGRASIQTAVAFGFFPYR